MTYKKQFMNFQTLWFYEDETIDTNTDIIYYRQVKNKVDGADEFYTLLIDLNKSEEEIFNAFSKTNKREIRKSISSDNLTCKMYHKDIDKSLLDEFFIAHNKFTGERGFSDISPTIYEEYRKNNRLYISTVSAEGIGVITWRVYITNRNRVRSLVSNSVYHPDDKILKRLSYRAGRLIKWEDILYFKEQNFEIYDLGGWYNGTEDKKKLAINEYKEAFSKTTEKSYNYQKCLTFKCYVLKFLIYVKNTYK